MHRRLQIAITLFTGAVFASPVLATNGDNMIGIGPISRAMGGTGIAAPQDAISAVFANPAAMCFTPGCDYAEVNFAGTLFAPNPSGSFNGTSSDSRKNIYAIPAIGISLPIDKDTRRLRFGLAAYGVTGLGVDYRGTALGDALDNFSMGALPGGYTSLQIMKFAPSLAYQITPTLSVGGALHIDYALLDLGDGSSPAYGIGGQLGVIWLPVENLSLGASVVTAQETEFKDVVHYQTSPTDFDWRNLTLEAPLTLGAGVAYTLFEQRLLLAAEGRWVNWGDAAGYRDFDWNDQWVAAFGAQFAVIPKKLFLRVGYNYGENPVDSNDGFAETGMRNVQGMMFPNPAFESFRILGFPALVEHHITAGIGYAFSEKFELNLGYMYALENSISETSANGFFAYEASLSEHSFELGMTWRF